MIDTPFRDCGPAPRLRYVPPGAAALLELAPSGCRWPIGAVEDAGFRFCPERRERGAYCAVHARMARR